MIKWIPIPVPVVSCTQDPETLQWAPQRQNTLIQVIATATGSESAKVTGLYEQLAQAAEQECLRRNKKDETEAIAVFPDWWQIRIEGKRPQLVVLYAETDSKGNLGPGRWSLHIPWFDERYRNQLKQLLPKYNKGNWQGMITLKDNSKIIVYASSKSVAETTSLALSRLCIGSQKPSPFIIKTGERRGERLKRVRVKPIRASYFSDGQEKMKPDWVEEIK